MEQKICGNCFAEMQAEEQVCAQCGCELQKSQEAYPLALPVGTILGGRYILGRVLGQGGFGITYLAQDYQKKEHVAVKEYFPDTMATRNNSHAVTAYTGTREDNFTYGKQCFLEEARTLAAFQGNPNIVGIYNYFEENGTAYFVMEYIEGQSLDQYVASQGGRLPWDEALQLLLPIMDALDAVHGRGIIHRDVTPDNICIMADGKVKLLDFGAARYSLGDRSRSLDVVLKHGFAPKEQYSRHGRQGPYTDVYSLAATLYYVLTGRKPPESIDRMEEDDLVLPSSLGVKLPISGEDALIKALAVQPTDRFQSVGAFAQALQGMENVAEEPQQTPLSSTEPSQKDLSYTAKTKLQMLQTIGRQLLQWCIRHKKWLIPAAACAVVVIVLAGVLISNNSRYLRALRLAQTGEFIQAQSCLPAKTYVKLVDASLLEEIEIGAAKEIQYHAACENLESGAYQQAMEEFDALGDFEDSKDKKYKAQYYYSEQLREEKKFEQAVVQLESLHQSGYPGAQEAINTTYCEWSEDLFQNAQYILAIDTIRRAPVSLQTQNLLEKLEKDVTEIAIEFYWENDFSRASELFVALSDYGDNEKYLTLIKCRNTELPLQERIDQLLEILDFEDAGKVLLYDDEIATEYLQGEWRSDDRRWLFIMYEDGSIRYNVPWYDYGDFYRIEYGDVLLYPADDYDNTQKLYSFRLEGPDRLKLFCYKDAAVYYLSR